MTVQVDIRILTNPATTAVLIRRTHFDGPVFFSGGLAWWPPDCLGRWFSSLISAGDRQIDWWAVRMGIWKSRELAASSDFSAGFSLPLLIYLSFRKVIE
ncbi:MAG: hypothetical protein DWH78_09805 [Planctomycetota bacterium]|nr:MAG: hypothetical protein DWH78_09805 [Planctomycetota bacterium]